MTRRTLNVDYLARVEGEGAMYIKIENEKVEQVELRIFEPPRFFEAFLRGRQYTETPDIVARICGICPVAYQMSAVHALEDAFGIAPLSGPIWDIRRLMYCGEWIESHVLHVFMLHAPDFLGYPSAIEMAKDHPQIVEQGLRMKKAGNEILRIVGGREIHPINVRVGGFYKAPSRDALYELLNELKWARDAVVKTAHWSSGLDFPDFERDYEYVALSHATEYPMNEGRIVSNKGIDIAYSEYPDHFEEQHVSYSTALHSVVRERGNYLVGPLARYNLNRDKLSDIALQTAKDIGLGTTCDNPFQSIMVRAIEVLYAFDEAIRIIENYQEFDPPHIDLPVKHGVGHWVTEAPRGLLFHRYEVNEDGTLAHATIIPPTSQNQGMIEEDLYDFVSRNVNLDDETLQWKCEQSIRNYDPCISCSTHFLKLKVDRS